MKSPPAAVLCGVALITPIGPLPGMLTQPARPAAAADTAQATPSRVSAFRLSQGRRAVLATRDHPGGAEAGGELSFVRTERQRRTREFLPGYPRQGKPEHRALAALPPGLQPAAVQSRVFQRDGQAQPGAAGGAGPGRVGAPEPL